jgi:hypothetical protein
VGAFRVVLLLVGTGQKTPARLSGRHVGRAVLVANGMAVVSLGGVERSGSSLELQGQPLAAKPPPAWLVA